jgi:hypothetical protein
MKLISKPFIIISCICLAACSNEATTENSNVLTDKTAAAPVQISQEVLNEMMQSLPQPIEIAQIISSSKTDVSKTVLIPAIYADKYADKYIQSLAFGAYGVDLGYINLNGKTLYMIEYLEGIKTLSEKLKVNQFFDFQTLAELAKNRNNTDSLVQLSTENFNKIDQFLREQNRGELSVLILVGAWVEGMNLFGEIHKNTASVDDISKRIGEQKIVFDNIYLLLEKLKTVDFYNKLGKDFVSLKLAYDKIDVSYKYNKPIMKEVNGQLVMKDQTEMIVTYTEQNINDVIKELQKIRSVYFVVK